MTRSWLHPAILACCALSGCGSSPPTRFYILNEIAPAATPVPVADQIPLRVEPVTLASELDRPELVTRSGPNRVHVAGSERWAAPLPDQIRRVLSDDLARRLPGALVADPNEPGTSEPRRLLRLAVAEFYADDTCAVTLRASWTLDNQHGQKLRGAEQVQLPSSAPCSGDVAALMSRALAALADRLAEALVR